MEKQKIYGFHAVSEAIRAGKTIHKIWIQKNTAAQSHPVIEQAKKNQIPVGFMSLEELRNLSNGNHQGIVAEVSTIQFAPLDSVLDKIFSEKRFPFLVLIDQVTDVRNFGAICRTAECAGVDAIVIPKKGSAALNADAVKTSSGALLHLPICQLTNLVQGVQLLKDSGVWVVACTEKANAPMFKSEWNRPIVFIVGSEEKGISPELLKLADEQIMIPMYGKIDSLNVSVATGVVLYERVRQTLL